MAFSALSNAVFMRIVHVRLPKSGKDWALLLIGVAVYLGVYFLLKHFFPDMNDRLRTVISTLLGVVILVIGGYGSD